VEANWEQAEIQCPGCREILVLRASLLEIWCPWCEEPYEIREVPRRADPSRIGLHLVKKQRGSDQAPPDPKMSRA
jgi:hypothetical protein